MSKFLTQEWLDEFKRVANETLSSGVQPSAAVQYHVTDGPHNDIAYLWRVQNGTLSEARLGTIPDPDFTVTIRYDDAVRMHKSEVDFATLFLQDRIDVEGRAWSSPRAAWRIIVTFVSLLSIAFSAESAEVQHQLRAITTY
jgi:hypothetical protein